jgi:arylsulfatase A-like enzyme
MPDRPNVVLILTDQHRGDAIGADPQSPVDGNGENVVHTPNLDNFVENGALFERAYTPAPSCAPARRCLWTGRTPASCNGPTWSGKEWDFEHVLPRVLRDAGYQTQMCGKLHTIPWRNHIGFEGLDLHSGFAAVEEEGLDDYWNWVVQESDGEFHETSSGLGRNGWDPRPWHLPEYMHPTHWTGTRAEEFLDGRDPTRPFFLTVSFHRPHQPFDPPQAYWDMYADRDLPEPVVGDWVEDSHGDAIQDHPPTNAVAADLPSRTVHRARAGYYGSITHIDQQIKRLDRYLGKQGVGDNTLFVMTADHGEMLGDHHLWRKAVAYEGAARVPLLVRFPDSWDRDPAGKIDRPVGLEDVMPTILDAAGVDIPADVEGRSLLRLCDDPEREDWREYYHGEHPPSGLGATHYLVDETTKYVWDPLSGDEHLFDLAEDPAETDELVDDPNWEDDRAFWRSRLAEHLAERPEGFSDGETLQTVSSDAWSVWNE